MKKTLLYCLGNAKVLACSLLLLGNLLGYAQEYERRYYFNKMFHATPGWYTLGSLSHALPDGTFLTIGKATLTQLGITHRKVYLRKSDEMGNEIWTINLDDTEDGDNMDIWTYGMQSCRSLDGSLVFVHSKKTLGQSDFDIFVMKISTNGTILWQNSFGSDEYGEHGVAIAALPNGGYIIAGSQTGNESAFYLLKIHENGSMDWESTYPTVSPMAFSVNPTPWDGGYILSGWTSVNAEYVACILKIDSIGQETWRKTFPSSCGRLTLPTVGQDDVANGLPIRYLMFNCLEGIDDNNIPHVSMLDEIGDIVWEYQYDIPSFNTFNSRPILLDNGGVVLTATSIEDPYNFMLWFSPDGQLVRSKKLYSYCSSSFSNVMLQSIDRAPDGGYILTGSENCNYSAWIVKTDSLGNTCHTENCDSTVFVVGSPTVSLPQWAGVAPFELSPNPATETTQILLQAPTTTHTAYLYAQNGQLLKTILVNGTTSSFSVADLPSGIYHIRLDNTGMTEKLIVIH